MIKKLDYKYPVFNDILTIEWCLGNTCNYACSYCNLDLHDGTNPWASTDRVFPFINKVREHAKLNNKKYIIWKLEGGEPTVWKDFLHVCEYITSEPNNFITVISNGSRSLKWWNRAASYFTTAHLSMHLEYADPIHIRQIADLLSEHKVLTSVMVMLSKENWDKGITAIEILKNSKNKDWAITALGITKINLENYGQPEDYTEEQRKFFNNSKIRPLSIINDKLPIDSNVRREMLADGIDFNPEIAIVNNESNWKGYNCKIGIDQIYIHNNGTLKLGGNCSVQCNNFTGKKFWEDFTFPTGPAICTQERCAAISDILVPKWKD